MRECVRREKLSSEKDRNFLWKIVLSSASPTIGLIVTALSGFNPTTVVFQTGTVLFLFSMFNILDRMRDPVSSPLRRNIDHPWEYFMPKVEIDKVARTFAYLSGKGKRLVREAAENRNL